ncbi:hypothetical protein CRUP_016449 [Coryphaenoides rupestris]|nr:hypothetical protein CRUP_016449 [Coryphaenoides rupestris]
MKGDNVTERGGVVSILTASVGCCQVHQRPKLKKELGLGGRVDIQHLDTGLWLNPVVVLRRLTVTVGGFRIELLPGPSYDTVGGADVGQAMSFQDGLTGGGEVALAVASDDQAAASDDQAAASDDQAADQKPTTEEQVGAGGVEEDAALELGPYVNPNDVQATNGSPTEPNSCSEETNQSASDKEKAPVKGNDAAKPTPNPPNNKTGSPTKDDCPRKTTPTLTTPPKCKRSRRGSPLTPSQNHPVLLATHRSGGPLRPTSKRTSPTPPSMALRTPPSPRRRCWAPRDTRPNPRRMAGRTSRRAARSPTSYSRGRRANRAAAPSVEEPQLFVPDNAPAATATVKKESAEEQPADETPADGAWDGTNSCGLCRKHHSNMFMVGCGRCEDWFHGDCVGLDLAKVQEMEEEDQMYVCLKCCADESVKSSEPGVQSAAKEPPVPQPVPVPAPAPSLAPPMEAAPVPEAQDNKPAAKQKPAPPQALASGGVRPIKKESDRRQSTEVKEMSQKTGAHQKHRGSFSSAPKKPASVEEIRRSVRDSLKEILLQRLKESDLKVAVERASEVARKTERELFQLHKDTDSKYKSKYRSLMFNLKDSKNNVLFRRVLKGHITPAVLSRMSPEELASKELAAWRQRENRHTIEMIEKEQREVERRPITKITHKGEIEIESEEPVKAAEPCRSPSPTKPLDLPAELLPLEQKAESSAKVDKDTTGQHKSHLFDLHCKICTGRMAPPVEEAPTKVVKVATTVARRPSAMTPSDEPTKSVTAMPTTLATPTSATEEDLHFTALEESLHSATTSSYEARSSFASAQDDGASFLSTLRYMWRGFVNMAAVAKLVTKAFPVSGALDKLTEDLPDSVQVGGRISPQIVWDYFDKIRATGTKEVCLIRFSPETEEDEISYTLLFAYFSSRKRFGVVSNNRKQVKDMYIIPLGATEKVPHQLVPFDGPGLENNRPNLLLGLIIRQRAKRDFLPVDMNETAAIIPETMPPPPVVLPTIGTRASEEEMAAKKYLSSLHPAAKKAKEAADNPPGAEEGEHGSEGNKPLRFLPGVLLGWGGELPPLPDFGAKPRSLPQDPRTAKATAKSPTTPAHRLDRFVIKKREPKPVKVEAVPVAPAAIGSDNNNNNNNNNRAPGQEVVAPPGAGISLRDKPTDVSTEAFLAGLSSPPPNGKDVDKKEGVAAADVSTRPEKESAEGTSPPAAKAQTESPRPPLSGILKKSSVYSSTVEDTAVQSPLKAMPTPQPAPAPSMTTAGPQASPLPQAKAPSGPAALVSMGSSSSSPSETLKDPRVPEAGATATGATATGATATGATATGATATAAPGPPVPQQGYGTAHELQNDWARSDASQGVAAAPPGQLGLQGPPEYGGCSGPHPEAVQTPPAQQQQNHSSPPLNSLPASHALPPPNQEASPEPTGQPSLSTAGVKDYKRSDDRYSDPWERPRHTDERDRDHHHRSHHGDKKSRHHDKYRERSRHRGHSEERRKERSHGERHKERDRDHHRHRRDSDYENGRRSSRDSYS